MHRTKRVRQKTQRGEETIPQIAKNKCGYASAEAKCVDGRGPKLCGYVDVV